MKTVRQGIGWMVTAAAFCCLAILLFAGHQAWAAADNDDFDNMNKKLYTAMDQATEPYVASGSGDRNLMGFYQLRQYPGSPPIIPHPVEPAYSGKPTDCLACHSKGGYSAEFGKFIPVTPHPENGLCFQCHAEKTTTATFVASNWQSVAPPRLGLSFLPGSPPSIPHSLQLRENCIACHTGPGAVAEIRTSHAVRGNCRQCHVPAVQQQAFSEFHRK